ncbi:MAG: hypothetical protein MI976_03005, partial [Pseudomonadales bacterium]|nr:hypothetical protein [Pseudomonadales bacterium]
MKKWSKSFRWQTAIPFLLTLGLMQLPGCGADYSGESEAESNDRSVTESNSINGNNSSASANSGESDTNPTQPQANDPQQILGEYFNKHIAEELETCAICHMPNGVADTSEGR